MEYVYALVTNGETFYVGRTNNLERRYREHLNDKSGSPKSKRIQLALLVGEKVTIEVMAEVEDGKLEGIEDDVMQEMYNSGHLLTNQKGGDTGALNSRDALILNKQIAGWKSEHKKNAKLNKMAAKINLERCTECQHDCKLFCRVKADEVNRIHNIFRLDKDPILAAIRAKVRKNSQLQTETYK